MEEVMNLEKIADTFKESAKDSWTLGDIRVSLAGRDTLQGADGDEAVTRDNAELYRVAKLFLESVQQGEEIYEN